MLFGEVAGPTSGVGTCVVAFVPAMVVGGLKRTYELKRTSTYVRNTILRHSRGILGTPSIIPRALLICLIYCFYSAVLFYRHEMFFKVIPTNSIRDIKSVLRDDILVLSNTFLNLMTGPNSK